MGRRTLIRADDVKIGHQLEIVEGMDPFEVLVSNSLEEKQELYLKDRYADRAGDVFHLVVDKDRLFHRLTY